MSDVRVRKAGIGDHEALLAMKVEQSGILLLRLGHSLEEISAWQAKFATRDYIIKHLKAPHSIYVVESGEQPVGMASLTIKDDGDDSYAYFGNLYCREDGEGHGSRLMEYRLGVLENFNLDYISCHVHSLNERARRFVKHYGFTEWGQFTDHSHGGTNIQYRRYP